MSYCLTTGIVRNCNENCAGGIGRVYVAPADAVEDVTIDGDGILTAMTMASGSQFFEYEFFQETGLFNEAIAREQGNTAVTSTLTGVFICRSQAKRNAIMELASS